MGNYPSYEAVKELRALLKDAAIKNWFGETFLQWQWWLQMVLLFLPWLLWWKVVDKSKLHVILLYGCLILIFSCFIDDLGTGLFWWTYPHKLIPTLNTFEAPNWSIVSCAMMVVFQYFKTWKTFLLCNFMLSLVISEVGERLFISLGLYELITWNLTYSIVFYNIAGALARWITLKIMKTVPHGAR